MALPALAAAVTDPHAAALLMRHAHADWPSFQGNDFDRPLTPEGEREAKRAGAAIRAAGHAPMLLLASAARRTRQTAEILADELGVPHKGLQFDAVLYNAAAGVLATRLQAALGQASGLVLLVAHNPGISQLARQWSGGAASFAPAHWQLVRLP